MEGTEVEDLKERLEAAEALSDELAVALESRVVIEQAKGILSERLGLSINDAFEILRYAARSSRTKIHDLAGRVVYEPGTPSSIFVAIARQSRWRAAFMRERNEAARERMDELTAAVQAQMERLAAREISPELERNRSRAARNQSLYRTANEAIESLEGLEPEPTAVREFICECAQGDCTTRVRLTIDEYEQVRAVPTHFVVHPPHVAIDLERVVRRAERYLVVEKLGTGAWTARALDPRNPKADPA